MAEKRGGTKTGRAPKKAGAQKKGQTRKKASASAAGPATFAAVQITPEQRYLMIQEAAYYVAERQGFECDPWKCWLTAEKEIDAQIGISSLS